MNEEFTVLLVDDSAFQRKIIGSYMVGTEFKVVAEAENGNVAIEKYKEHSPDIVVLDVVLPEKMGSEVLRTLIEINPAAVVLMLSSLGTEESVKECLSLGAKTFIQKPFDKEVLLNRMREVVSPKDGKKPIRFFGQFLMDRGVITREMFLDAVEYQKSINLPLCALAVEMGYLSQGQLEELDAAPKTSDKEFMASAIETRMLTPEQLEELRKTQSESRMFLGEALVQRGHLTLVQLDKLFEEYRKEQKLNDTDIDRKLKDIPEKEVVAALLATTVDIFLNFAKQIVKVKSIEKTGGEPDDIAYVFAQRVTGDKNFCYSLALSDKLILALASHILQQEVSEIDEMALDAVSEFVNIVIGNGCTKLSIKNWKVRPEPPQIMTKDMVKKMMKTLPPSSIVNVKLQTSRGEFIVLIFFAYETEQ